jgi:DNA-binding NarL/FixJ family response regulator
MRLFWNHWHTAGMDPVSAQPPHRRRLVLVDDNQGFRLAAERFLATLAGFALAGMAADGAEGLRLIERVRPDAVIMDVSMPVMNGFELAARLRESAAGPRIIMISLFMDEAMRREALRLGADAVLAKEDFVGELPRVLARVLGLPMPEPGHGG